MAGGYQESHEVLRKHGGTVHGLTDRLQGALDAARLVSMPADAYGILCQPFARLLNPLEDAGLDVLDGGVEAMDSAAVELADTPDVYQRVDDENARMVSGFETGLP